MITGTLGSTAITEGRLRGGHITFKAGATTYAGTVTGSTMQGKTSAGQAWTATK